MSRYKLEEYKVRKDKVELPEGVILVGSYTLQGENQAKPPSYDPEIITYLRCLVPEGATHD